MELQILQDAGREINKYWELSTGEDSTDYKYLLQALKSQLSKQLSYYLDSDMEYLINTLYRRDIREKDFHMAMQQPSIPQIADALAEVIIKRELEKAYTRAKYRTQQ